MQYAIKTSVTINASPEQVWDKLMNPDNLKHWLTGFISIEHISGTPGNAGSISILKFKERRKEVEITETVVISNPCEHYDYGFRMENAEFSSDTNIRLVSFGTKTDLIQTVQLSPNSFILKLLMPLLKGSFERRTQTELMKLKSFIETNP